MAEETLLIVRDLKALDASANGRPFASLLVIKKLAAKTASNGNSFFGLELGDRTGSFNCTVFNDSPVFEPLKAAGEGAVVRIEGKVEFYQGRLSPRLAKAVALAEAELGSPGLLDNLVEKIEDEGIDQLFDMQMLVVGSRVGQEVEARGFTHRALVVENPSDDNILKRLIHWANDEA